MNKSYLIVPVILLAVFGFSYNSALKEMQAKEDANHAKAAAKKADEDKHKAEVDARATADAKKHQEERDAEDRKKQEKKQADYDDAMRKLRDEANDYTAQAEKLGKEAADLEKQISDSRNEKEKLTRESLELAKGVELAKINRRNAELEIQRMIDMVAKKINDSSITAAPPLSPTPPATK
jgi:predicted  nucleic acid-binding Zn-ribbon protein